MRWIGVPPLAVGVALIVLFTWTSPSVVTGSDYAAINGGGVLGVIVGAILALAGLAFLFGGRGGPPADV